MGKSIVNSRTFLFLSFGIMLLSFVGIISNYLSQLTTLQHNAHTNVLKYDDINAHSDGYFNNAFIGNWTMYNSKISKI